MYIEIQKLKSCSWQKRQKMKVYPMESFFKKGLGSAYRDAWSLFQF